MYRVLKVYSKPDCKWCTYVKDYLLEKGYQFEDINLAHKDNRQARKFMSDLKLKDIPILLYDDKIFKEYTTVSKGMFLKELQKWLDEVIQKEES